MIAFGQAVRASASPIFVVNLSPDATGLSFATSVFDFTPPVNTGGGPATAILGAPDGGGNLDPNTQAYVDFGGDVTISWAASVGFGTTFADGPGVDARIFDVQLDPTEGFNLFASADGSSFIFLGEFTGPPATVGAYNTIDIDFNGAALPAGASYLRFVGDTVPINSFTRGLDFDAVGVFPAPTGNAPVPEPGTLVLLASGSVLLWRSARRTKRQVDARRGLAELL